MAIYFAYPTLIRIFAAEIFKDDFRREKDFYRRARTGTARTRSRWAGGGTSFCTRCSISSAKTESELSSQLSFLCIFAFLHLHFWYFSHLIVPLTYGLKYFRSDKKINYAINFAYLSLIRIFNLRSKILSLNNERKKGFFFAFSLLNRIFDLRSKILPFGLAKLKSLLFC